MKWQTKVRQGVKRNSSGVKLFLEGVKKNLGGLTPQKIRPWPPIIFYVFTVYTYKLDIPNPTIENIWDGFKHIYIQRKIIQQVALNLNSKGSTFLYILHL